MKVIICGGGNVGESIARYLSLHNSNVVLIDNAPEKTDSIGKALDLQVVCGPASRPDTLERADAENADMFIAVTPYDEVNILACQMAHTLFKVPTKIARIRDVGYLDEESAYVRGRDNKNAIDVVISPESEVALSIFRRLKTPDAFDSLEVAQGQVTILGLRLEAHNPLIGDEDAFSGTRIDNVRYVLMRASRRGQLLPLTSSLRLEEGDEIYMAMEKSHVENALLGMNYNPSRTRQIIIVGGGNIGLSLAHHIQGSIHDVSLKVIERNETRAQYIASILDHTIVMNGNALEPQVLHEANIKACQAMVAVTEENENNILTTLLAKHYGCEHVTALISNQVYSGMVTKLGIDTVVNPRDITISKILQYMRRGRILSVYTVNDPEGEIIELEVLEKSSIVGKRLQDVHLPKDVHMGALLRGNDLIALHEDTTIKAGDHITLFSPERWVRDVEKLFSAQFRLF
ncbi:MAG: Trk system potassium transporter TrkA [Alphaproteobacteria bacterium GM7ARS4]|nr:Trk system potassium transporter TrkA [Alphaproteobacteria bacterium GM7ARS4]